MIAARSLSISITETAIKIGEVNVDNGRYDCNAKSYPINNWASADNVIAQWKSAIDDFSNDQLHFSFFTIAMPGPFDYEKGISYIKENRNLKSLYGVNIKNDLVKTLGITSSKIIFYNDAVCALAADLSLSLAGENVLGLYFNEGFGSALCQNGKIIDAELWNKPYLNETSEDFFSIKWLRKNYFKQTGLNIVDVNEMNDFSLSTIKELYKIFTDHLANYIKILTQDFQIQSIVLGGETLAGPIDIFPSLIKKLRNLNVEVEIVKSQLSINAALIGTQVLYSKMQEV